MSAARWTAAVLASIGISLALTLAAPGHSAPDWRDGRWSADVCVPPGANMPADQWVDLAGPLTELYRTPDGRVVRWPIGGRRFGDALAVRAVHPDWVLAGHCWPSDGAIR